MPHFRISEAAGLLGVSDDTVRRWADTGRLEVARDASGRLVIDGAALAAYASSLAESGELAPTAAASARNRFRGIVTRVAREGLVAQVELQCGPHRVVSLMTREAADDLGLAPGVVGVASVKATNVVVEVPAS